MQRKALQTFKDTAIVSIEKFLSRLNPENEKLYAFLDKHPECEATIHPLFDQQNRNYTLYVTKRFREIALGLKNADNSSIIEALFHDYIGLIIYACKHVQKRSAAYLDFCGVQKNVPDSERMQYMEMLVTMSSSHYQSDILHLGEMVIPLEEFIELFIPQIKQQGEDHYPTIRAAQDNYLAEYVNNFKKGNIYQLPVSRTGLFSPRNTEAQSKETQASREKDYGLRVHVKMK